MNSSSEPFDLLVIGGGMAGLSAAARVAQAGGTVAIVEKGESTGGSAAVAEFLWTAPNLGVLREEIPDGERLSRNYCVVRRV